jgi:hypothetical protein
MNALSNYFEGVCAKKLSHVDALPTASNQHEIGSNKFKQILGDPGSSRLNFQATFLLFDDFNVEPVSCIDSVTFYDARANNPHRSAEFRLYYKDNLVTQQLKAGDLCIVAKLKDGKLLITLAREGTDHESRLKFLFDLKEPADIWHVNGAPSAEELDFAQQSILQALGLDTFEFSSNDSELLVRSFGNQFPGTKEFSEFSRKSIVEKTRDLQNPDAILEAWLRQEEVLFRALENVIVSKQLEQGFHGVDEFVQLALSVLNRRKARAGLSLENHLAELFNIANINFERTPRIDGNSRPDFLFPSAAAYRDLSISSPPLQMLAAKSSCKDRWRQILAEVSSLRIPVKHLCTLETAITENQTDEMQKNSVQLVVPSSIRRTYTEKQQKWIYKVEDFIDLLRSNQL